MKPILCHPLLFIFLAFSLSAEQLKLYSCDVKLIKLPEYTIDVFTENGNIPSIWTYKIKKDIGIINTGDAKFSAIAKTAFSYDRSLDPFYGPGFSYIAKDSEERYYVIYFEFEEGHETFKGVRFGIGQLNDLESNRAIFVGSPHNGTSFDENILKQLKKITEQQ